MALYHLTNATYQPVWRDISKKKYFEIRKSVGRKILESEINSPKYKYIFYAEMSRIVCAFLELRDQKSYVTSFVEQEHIGDEFFFSLPPFCPLFPSFQDA